MARKRFVSPEFFTHAVLYEAETRHGLPLRLAFIGLWTHCDRRGIFTWRPRELKLGIMPYDAVDFAVILDALWSEGFIERYVVDGKEYGRVPSLPTWQSFHVNEKASKAPEPSNGVLKPSNGRPCTPVAVAVAITTAVAGNPAVVLPADEPPAPRPATREDVLAERLTSDAGRNALTALLASKSASKAAILGEIEACTEGMRGKEHQPTDAQLDQVLSDYVGAFLVNDGWKPTLFRGCIRRALRGHQPVAGTDADYEARKQKFAHLAGYPELVDDTGAITAFGHAMTGGGRA